MFAFDEKKSFIPNPLSLSYNSPKISRIFYFLQTLLKIPQLNLTDSLLQAYVVSLAVFFRHIIGVYSIRILFLLVTIYLFIWWIKSNAKSGYILYSYRIGFHYIYQYTPYANNAICYKIKANNKILRSYYILSTQN